MATEIKSGRTLHLTKNVANPKNSTEEVQTIYKNWAKQYDTVWIIKVFFFVVLQYK